MSDMSGPSPTKIVLHKISKTLEILFDTNERFVLPCSYLRVSSLSAEMRGKDVSQMLQEKQQVSILAIEPVGQYAVKFIFSDGHNTGIYSWKTLYELGRSYVERS